MRDFGTLAVTGVVAASLPIMIDVRLVFRTAYATDRGGVHPMVGATDNV
jgi:hypothetical protein